MSCSYRRAFGYPPEFSKYRRALFSCTWRWENGKKDVEAGKGNAMPFCQEVDWAHNSLYGKVPYSFPCWKTSLVFITVHPPLFWTELIHPVIHFSQKASQSTSRLWIALVCNNEISQSKPFSLKLKLTYTRGGQLHIDIETAKICQDGKCCRNQ